MVEKRGLDGDSAGGQDGAVEAKKPRVEVPTKPSLSLEALEKAKKALQLQKELREKLKNLPQLQKKTAAASGAAADAAALPPPPAKAEAPALPPPPVPPPTEAAAEVDTKFYDPRMSAGASRKLARKARPTFEFVQEGEFQRQAEELRLKARYGRNAPPSGPIGPAADPRAAGNPNLVPIGTDVAGSAPDLEIEPEILGVPDVEWWDQGLLATGSYEADVPQDTAQPCAIKETKITLYVEHPVPIEPPAEAPPPPPQPLKLTARELKKLRTQRRQAREKEKQDLIRQGLREPPKPKVKLSNLYRVLGEQAVADPTMLEMETRKQMAEREAAHADRNLARALTPAERRDKKIKKLFDDTGLEVITSVYKIERLDNGQNKYKVDINAKENHMTGVLLITPDFSLVVAEGCNKATKRYAKLMLRRIDWDAPPTSKEDQAADMDEDLELPPNHCHLVWQGLVKDHAFEHFRVENCRTVEHAQQILTMRGVPHYWDAAKNFIPGEAVGLQLGD